MISLRPGTKAFCIAMSPLANYCAQGGLYLATYWLFYLIILITLKKKQGDYKHFAFYQMHLHSFWNKNSSQSFVALNLTCWDGAKAKGHVSVKHQEVTSSGVFPLTSSLGAHSMRLVMNFFLCMKWLSAALIVVNSEQTGLLKIFRNLQGLS